MAQTQNIPITLQTSSGFAMPKKKSGGCGCCLFGCFSLVLLILVAGVGGYFAFRNNPGFFLSDRVVLWAYVNYGRPKLETLLPATMTPEEKKEAIGLADKVLQDYLKMPDPEKAALLNEALTAVSYYYMGKVLPPGKIPHLLAFIEKQKEAYELLHRSPRLTQ